MTTASDEPQGGGRGREFFKMTGSGNDFIFFDARDYHAGDLATGGVIQALCARGSGVGADGVVFIEPSRQAAFRMRYFNSDGSLASLCGNAALCSVRLSAELAAAPPEGSFAFESDAGILHGRITNGLPEIDMQPVREVTEDAPITRLPGERRIGFALAGVPHLVVLVDNLEDVDVLTRGRALRRDPSLPGGGGANVNFVAPRGRDWAMRTFERGVEAETLACGTGAVASALLTLLWASGAPGVTGVEPTKILTRSARTLSVRFTGGPGKWSPSLAGEGRLVYRGRLVELL
ncbi:MAG: diaminopimelate epimerase [Gemmatimonadaceae bacterium]